MIEIADKKFDVIIKRKHIHNIILKVEDNKIYVSCPYYVLNVDIYKFINEKRKWIYKASIKHEGDSKLNIDSTIYYFGKEYKLEILKGNRNVKIVDDTIYVRCRSGDKEGAIKSFYECSKTVIIQYVLDNDDKYLDILKEYGYYKEPEYIVKYLKSMWGCCYSKQNKINLSVRLIHFDKETIEAILWHELLHLIIPNHSKRYHQILELHMPNYKELIKELH